MINENIKENKAAKKKKHEKLNAKAKSKSMVMKE
jgi:hypothetical protein